MKYLSGPVSVTRLENHEGKVVYLFGDFHYDLSEQTVCKPHLDSMPIDVALRQAFMKNKQKMALFAEIGISDLPLNHLWNDRTTNYISKVGSFIADPESRKTFKNVMFHYFDSRNADKIYGVTEPVLFTNVSEKLHEVKEFLASFLEENKLVTKVVTKKYNNPKLGKTLKTVYTDLCQVSQRVQNQVERSIIRNQKRMKFLSENAFRISHEKRKQIINKIEKSYFKYCSYLLGISSIFIDLYLLRRLLDKDYGTTLHYIYTGLFHKVDILMFLLKYTDYKVTHTTGGIHWITNNTKKYSPTLMLKHFDYPEMELTGVLAESPGKSQCVDISSFPPNLT